MKRSSPLWGSVSVLIGVVIAILALVRGAWLVPLLLLVFTAWGLWVVIFQLQPAWDSIRGYCALYGRRETVCDAELSEAYFFSELQECGTPQQAAFALLRLHGYSIAEIAARYKLDPRRVRRMLKSLYSAYLRFHGDGKEAKK